jgi:hypothetical protein
MKPGAVFSRGKDRREIVYRINRLSFLLAAHVFPKRIPYQYYSRSATHHL